ncbi:ComEC/Rec2 family competence protein [Halopseudomonas pachastrellae]|nr:ComEC/Rec2 family competence protein [Halopseudomonas pachastrellae]
MPFSCVAACRSAALGLCAGACWALAWHQWQLGQRLPSRLDNQTLELVGTVAALPEQTETGWRFVVRDGRRLDGQRLPLMRLHWWGGEAVRAGEQWQLTVRLRAPRGMRNPGTFDYEAWLYAQGIGAVGSVRGGQRIAAARRPWGNGVIDCTGIWAPLWCPRTTSACWPC